MLCLYCISNTATCIQCLCPRNWREYYPSIKVAQTNMTSVKPNLRKAIMKKGNSSVTTSVITQLPSTDSRLQLPGDPLACGMRDQLAYIPSNSFQVCVSMWSLQGSHGWLCFCMKQPVRELRQKPCSQRWKEAWCVCVCVCRCLFVGTCVCKGIRVCVCVSFFSRPPTHHFSRLASILVKHFKPFTFFSSTSEPQTSIWIDIFCSLWDFASACVFEHLPVGVPWKESISQYLITGIQCQP